MQSGVTPWRIALHTSTRSPTTRHTGTGKQPLTRWWTSRLRDLDRTSRRERCWRLVFLCLMRRGDGEKGAESSMRQPASWSHLKPFKTIWNHLNVTPCSVSPMSPLCLLSWLFHSLHLPQPLLSRYCLMSYTCVSPLYIESVFPLSPVGLSSIVLCLLAVVLSFLLPYILTANSLPAPFWTLLFKKTKRLPH